jgi:hypothetical protein
MNSGGAVGFYYLDITKLANGVHTISWNVYDNVGHGDGIGSRYFNVFNSSGSVVAPEEPVEQPLPNGHGSDGAYQTRNRLPGNDPIEIEELGRIEIPLGAIGGYQLVAGQRVPLPIGSSLKRGVFYWQPGPGFLGAYDLVFERGDAEKVPVHVKIRPKTYIRSGTK